MRFLPLGRLALAGAALLAACQSHPAPSAAPTAMLAPYQTEKFRLSARPGCADGYPARIDEGHFINSAGSGFPVPSGHFLSSSWDGSGTGWVVGDEWQTVPELLELRWFSYTEDKFYEGHFLLPQRRLYDLLKQGFWSSGFRRQETYDGFTASVLPTGVVLVWLTGAGPGVFVGRYQAHEIQYDFNQFNGAPVDRAEVVRQRQAPLTPAVKHEIATRTLSPRKWDAYLKTYSWKLEFSRPLALTDYGISLRNGENLNYPPTSDVAAYTRQVLFGPTRKAVPEYAMLYLAGAYGRKRLLKVKAFDEHETMAAFQTLATKHPDAVITLHVEIDEKLTQAVLSLRAGNQTIVLHQSPVEFFDL